MLRLIAIGVGLMLMAGAVISQIPMPKVSPINEARLKAHIRFLSDDLLEGRGTGARGGEIAAKYIASQLEEMGAKGAGEHRSVFSTHTRRPGGTRPHIPRTR